MNKFKQKTHGFCAGAFLLAIFTGCCSYADWAYNGVTGTIDNGDWVLKVSVSGNRITVTGVDTVGANGHIDFDSLIDGGNYTLVAIGGSAFYNANVYPVLSSITFPETLETVGDSAFRECNNLADVTPLLPASVRQLGNMAFRNCPIAGDLVLSNPSLTSIGGDNGLFENAGFTSVTMEDSGIETIGASAFSGCIAITNVVFSPVLKNIRASAFYNCTSITDIFFPQTLTTIADAVFRGCTSLTNVVPLLPATVTGLGDMAFRDCPIIGELVLSNPLLTSIGSASVLFTSLGLTSVSMEDSGIATIGQNAFSGCTSITNVTFSPALKNISASAFFSCTNITSIILPETLEIIGDAAFRECNNLADVTPLLPASVRQLGNMAFRNCPIAGDLVLSNPSLTSIGGENGLFENARFTSVTMEDSGIETIGVAAFSGCIAITNVVFSPALKTVRSLAFASCTAVKKVWFYGDVPTFITPFGSWTHLQARFYVPRGNETWEEYRDTYVEPLDSMEEGDFAAAYPGEKLPVGKFLTPGVSNGANQYFCWWAENLTILIIR